jgi:hypothetical protein
MANRPQQLTLPPPRSYTRTDFAALRAFVQRVPLATIARLYFDPERAPTRSTVICARCATTWCTSRCCTARPCWPST